MKSKIDFQAAFNNGKYGNGLRCVIICALAVSLVAGINIFSATLPTKITNLDMSVSKIHSISTESEEKVKALEKEVQLYLISEPGEEDENCIHVLNLYADLSEKLAVKKVDPAISPDLIQQFTEDKVLGDNSLIVICGNRTQLIRYEDYFSGGKFMLEDYINSGIDYVTSDHLKKVYFLTGHGEEDISDDVKGFLGLDGFETEELNLISSPEIPKDASGIIVNGATSDITKNEATILSEYMKKGGKMVLSTGYTDNSMSNWETVTEYFGASFEKGYVAEADEKLFAEGNASYIFPYIYTDANETITSGVKYVLMPSATGIRLENQDVLRDTLQVKKILQTSENAGSIFTNIFTGEKDYIEGPFNLGISVEEKTDSGVSKFVWFSSRYMMDDSVNSYVGGGNLTMILNAVGWVCEEPPVASIHGKTVSSKYLTLSENTKNVWKILLIGGFPIVVLVLGVMVCVRRKRR